MYSGHLDSTEASVTKNSCLHADIDAEQVCYCTYMLQANLYLYFFFPNFFLNNKFTIAGLKRDHGKFKTGVCFFVLRSLHHYVRNIHQWVWQTITLIYTTVSICVNGNRWLRIF